MKKTIPLTLLSLFLNLTTQAQKEGNIWYFGNNAGIDFNSGTPTALSNGALVTYDNSSTISDAQGSVLFYTNGVTVWNKNHSIMSNGNFLKGHNSGGQSALIIPQPQASNYYIFTVDNFAGYNGLRYSIVDMNLQAGLGAVTDKNVLLFSPSTEKIDAIYNPNNDSYWIITHRWASNDFNCYKLTSTGLDTVPVVSSVGTVNTGGSPSGYNAVGQMTISKDGTTLVSAIYSDGIFEWFDFDITTGQISNSRLITGYSNAWGTAFSPDGSVLYVTQWYSDIVTQFNMNAGSLSAIIASATVVGQATSNSSTGYKAGYLQLGPDDKIYIARFDMGYLAVINNPNSTGTGCNFVNNGISLGSGISQAGLSRVPVKIETSTGINQTDKGESEFHIYPNPNIGIFKLSLGQLLINKNINIKIYNEIGQEVYKISEQYQKTFNIDMRDMKSGIYFIQVVADNSIFTQKIIIEE